MKPKRVSLEGDIYTVEVETEKFTAVVRVSAEMREIKEYDVQPKNEEGFFASFSPKTIIIVFAISAIVNAVLYFGFTAFGL